MPRRRRPLAGRVRSACRSALAFLFSNVGVIVLVTGYTIAGAFMFQAIEGASEIERVNNMTRERDKTADILWHNTLKLNLFNETEMKVRISEELVLYQRKVVVAVRRGWDGGRSSRQWSFSSGFLYSLTVITTIGYGNLSPRTSWGKLATIVYALLGLPLFLLYLSNLGELLAGWFKCLYALVCLCRGCPGFSRRRVLRQSLKDPELNGTESYERRIPRRRYSLDSCDVVPQRPSFRIQYNRSVSAPHYSDGRQPNHDRLRRHNPSGNIAQNMHNDDRNNYRTAQRCEDFSRHNKSYNNNRQDNMYSNRRQRFIQENRNKSYRNRDNRSYDNGRGYREYSDTVRWSDEEVSSAFTYVSFDAQSITVPIGVCVTVMVSYIIFGSMIFGMWEKWDLLDGAYFCFISLSSIGFGDFVPGERVYSEKIETSFIVCSMYLMLGMALVAMCFNLMQEQVIHYFSCLKRAFLRMCRCKR